MEDNLQRVFSVLISILILFILPLYITFEKIDDISYSLALKITSNFVDNVTAKGYITEEMYNDFVTRLSTTGNVYDVKLEHISKKYNPAYYLYDSEGNLIEVLDYSIYSDYINDSSNSVITVGGTEYNLFHTDSEGNKVSNIKLSYNTSEIKYSEKQILEVFNKETSTEEIPYSKLSVSAYIGKNVNDISIIPYMYGNYKIETDSTGAVSTILDNDNRIYTMNKGDEFSVRIKNENTTIATVLFNSFTLGIGGEENNTRVYINYGGTIAEEEYKNLDAILDEIPFVYGDVNLNGYLDNNDANIIQKYVSSYITLSEVQKSRLDVDNNGIINIIDSTYIQEVLQNLL